VLEGLVDRGAADLVIMGGLSRGRLKDFLIGSTAQRLLERSRADVLIVKPPHPG
jgi:nucleotide-binding universal stress UspA family protein